MTAEVSATRADFQFGNDARIGGVRAVSLLRRQVRIFDFQLHAFGQALRASALEIGNAFGHIFHLENSAQAGIIATRDQRGCRGAAAAAAGAASAGNRRRKLPHSWHSQVQQWARPEPKSRWAGAPLPEKAWTRPRPGSQRLAIWDCAGRNLSRRVVWSNGSRRALRGSGQGRSGGSVLQKNSEGGSNSGPLQLPAEQAGDRLWNCSAIGAAFSRRLRKIPIRLPDVAATGRTMGSGPHSFGWAHRNR